MLHREIRMHARSPLLETHDLRIWLLVAIVVAVLGLLAVIWDPHDMGDGLVMGPGGSVSTAWDSAQGRLDDFLFGSPPARPAESGR